jgi:hypothetical protein
MNAHHRELLAAMKARVAELRDEELARLLECGVRGQPYRRSPEVAAQIAGFEERIEEIENAAA